MNGTLPRGTFAYPMNLWNLVKIGAQVVFLVLVIVRERVKRENERRNGARETRTEGMKGNTL